MIFTEDDEYRWELYDRIEKLILQLARLLNHIHSDIFQKEPRGQVSVGQEIRWKRCIKLLNEADKARTLIEELWDYPEDVYKLAEENQKGE